MPRIAHHLCSLALFSDMQPAELGALAAGCRLRLFDKGASIFRLGEPCQEFHAVVTGQVKLYGLSPSGQEKVIELLGPGESFAEALMFTDRPYIVNAQALMDSQVLSVSKQAVLAEIARDSRFALRMLAGISRRLHGLVHDVQASALHSGVQRVIGYLLREHESLGGTGATTGATQVTTVSLPFSKSAIASRLSLTPEYFSRVLRELEDQRLIAVDKRDIHIPDLQRLACYPVR